MLIYLHNTPEYLVMSIRGILSPVKILWRFPTQRYATLMIALDVSHTIALMMIFQSPLIPASFDNYLLTSHEKSPATIPLQFQPTCTSNCDMHAKSILPSVMLNTVPAG